MNRVFAEYMQSRSDLAAAGVLKAAQRSNPSPAAALFVSAAARRRRPMDRLPRPRNSSGVTYIFDVANLDEAIKWAAKCPGALVGIGRSPAARPPTEADGSISGM